MISQTFSQNPRTLEKQPPQSWGHIKESIPVKGGGSGGLYLLFSLFTESGIKENTKRP